MNILFLCGSLESGKDGVGDYTMRLAENLFSFGNQVHCIAIHDRYVSLSSCHSLRSYALHQDSIGISRFSANTPWRKRFQTIAKIVQIFQPDWISLQYVPYSFSRNGLPISFVFGLTKISFRTHWHIMFHELWIGSQGDLKRKLTSCMQKLIIRVMVNILKPSLINTSNKFYQSLLRKFSIESEVLNLFGNIPIHSTGAESPTLPGQWTFLIFGSLHPNVDLFFLFRLIEKARIAANIKTCELIFVGRLDSDGAEILQRISVFLSKEQFSCFTLRQLGEQSVTTISRLMQTSSFGISMTPFEWVEKSGSVAAMVDHGLPVIVSSVNDSLSDPTKISQDLMRYFLFANHDLPSRLCLANRLPPNDRSIIIAKSFEANLKDNQFKIA